MEYLKGLKKKLVGSKYVKNVFCLPYMTGAAPSNISNYYAQKISRLKGLAHKIDQEKFKSFSPLP